MDLLKKKSVLVFAYLNLGLISGLCVDPLVKVSQGFLQGTVLKTKNGKTISAFMGMPYALPPIGKLRFSSPQPVKNWEGINLATKDGNICTQHNNGTVMGNEDCLFLNIFTPILDFNEALVNCTLLPVMVLIPGGGFQKRSSNYYGPRYLMDKNIVLVSLNYRLGILGFLSTGDSVAPGNFGLKDQVLALKWVQENIRVFGGDPNRVTLFGQSGGAASITYHLLSNSSNGLFHQYISQSGSALVPWGYRDRSQLKKDVDYIAGKVGCPTNDSEDIVNCLRNASFYELVNATTYNALDLPEILWVPTNEVESDDAFLTDHPQNLINQNKIKDYPFMSGSVHDEGLYLTAPLYSKDTSESMSDILDKFINITYSRFFEPGNLPKFSKAIKDYYFNGSVPSANDNEFRERFTKLTGDSSFLYPVVIMIEKMIKVGKSPIYLYLFDYYGNLSFLSTDFNITRKIGVTNGDELFSLFSGEHSCFTSAKDNYVIDLMTDLWTSFAINGKPTSEHLAVTDLWQPYQQRRFLQISNKNSIDTCVTLEEDYFTDRMNFWIENFPLIQV